MAENCEESEEERGRRLARKRKQRERAHMQPPPREVRIDECEREELQLAKQRKRMAVLRNADYPRRSARLQAEQLRLQQRRREETEGRRQERLLDVVEQQHETNRQMAVPELQQQPQLSHSDLQECAVAEFLQVKTAEDCDKSREDRARRLARRRKQRQRTEMQPQEGQRTVLDVQQRPQLSYGDVQDHAVEEPLLNEQRRERLLDVVEQHETNRQTAVPELQQQPQLSHSDLQECAVAEFLQVKTAEDCDKSREERARRLARRRKQRQRTEMQPQEGQRTVLDVQQRPQLSYGDVQDHAVEEPLLNEQRRERLLDVVEQHENSVQSGRSEMTMTKHQYLHEKGWCDPDCKLHCQPWVKETMDNFHTKQTKWQHHLCSVCHELWPTRVAVNTSDAYICTRCKRDKREPKQYSDANDMHPGDVPSCLHDLTKVEEMLISRACPIMSVYRKHGGQWGYKGHVVNLPQDIQGFLDQLPCNISDLPILIIRRRGAENTHADFRVRREKILFALQWLKTNNPCYKDITINHGTLQLLPEDGIPPELLTVEEKENQEDCSIQSDISEEHNEHDSSSFLPLPTRQRTEEEAIHSAITTNGNSPLNWPNIGIQPINEFQTPYLATASFPTLFPYGTGDPTNPGRQHPVSLTDGFKHLIRYGEISADGVKCWRFASHPRFIYWALNMKQRHQLLSQARIYLHQNQEDANLSVEELRAMVGNSGVDQLMKRVQRYAAKLQGSSQYWFQHHQELQALLEQKGPPTFFWTVSSADNYWPELHNLMPHSTDNPSYSERVHAVINNPHIADWYFTSKLSDFIEHWLYNTLDAEWHWYRFEYQSRGSTHAHGCAKLKNDPAICALVEKAATGWLAEQELLTGIDEQGGPTQDVIKEGLKAKQEVLEYADWLVTTCNYCLPSDTCTLPVPHPCALKLNDIANSDNDYHDLVNCVQCHTRCSAAYCLRTKKGQQKCRFDYPRPLQTMSTLEFEKRDNGTVCATLTTQRNDPRVNSHNRVMLQHWRANVDMQIIIDVEACARYMAKYAAKAEPRSTTVHSIFKTCVQSLSNEGNAHKILRTAMLRAVGERDFSSQETTHMLLSLPLVSCSYNFTTVSLYNSRLLTQDKESGELTLQQSILDQYGARHGLPDTDLIQFAAHYTMYQGKLHKRPAPVIVRTFPQHSPNPQSESYGQYCKCQLLKYKPWKHHPSNAWGGGTDTDETCIAAYTDFLRTEAGRLHIPHFASELAKAQQYITQTTDSDDESDQLLQNEHQDDWMLLCRLNMYYASNTDSGNDAVDWAAPARALDPPLLRACPTWIQSQRKQSQDNSNWNRQLPPVDVRTLNEKQRLAYNIIVHHHAQLASNHQPTPLHMIVCGTAGTGKSYLISAIAHALGDSCLLTGTTGMASFNICGKTVHSALHLPIHHSNSQDLQGSALQRLQLQMQNVQYVIIDEMSMIGHRTLALIDRRLRQATAKLNEPMGGLSVILFGDFGQLPPVGDRPLYAPPSNCDVAIHGHSIYSMFTSVIILSCVLRQAGSHPAVEAFRDLLLRLRDGNLTQNDWKLLLQRTPQHAHNAHEFTDAVRLFYDKENVAKYNHEKLYQLGTPVARIDAIHSSPAAASAKPDDASGLHPVIFLAPQAHVMLTANLWQEVGLCNGAGGVVHQLLYQEGHAPPQLPIAVLVDFANYTGPSFFNEHPKCVPIPPLLSEWNSAGKHLSRQQLPLQLRYAMTIHKSQGQTLQKAVIDIGSKEYAAGCTFVAVSRLRQLEDGLFKPMSFQRLQAIAKGKNLMERINEEARLHQLSEQTAKLYQSLL